MHDRESPRSARAARLFAVLSHELGVLATAVALPEPVAAVFLLVLAAAASSGRGCWPHSGGGARALTASFRAVLRHVRAPLFAGAVALPEPVAAVFLLVLATATATATSTTPAGAPVQGIQLLDVVRREASPLGLKIGGLRLLRL